MCSFIPFKWIIKHLLVRQNTKLKPKAIFPCVLISLRTSILRSSKRNSLAANGTLLWRNYSAMKKPHSKCGHLCIALIYFLIIIIIILSLCRQVKIKWCSKWSVNRWKITIPPLFLQWKNVFNKEINFLLGFNGK